jgi:transcriptional regulator with XRE-family HTH domain
MDDKDLDNYVKQIARRIKDARTFLGMTQEELGEMVGTNARQIWRWESGENVPKADVFGLIASALGISSDFLLGIKDIFLSDEPSRIEGLIIHSLRNGDKLGAITTIINNNFAYHPNAEDVVKSNVLTIKDLGINIEVNVTKSESNDG